MTDWNKDEKTLMIIGTLTIAIILVGFVLLFVVIPIINQTAHSIEKAAQDAKAQDDRKILPPSGDDLDYVGKWGDAISIGWTGKNTFVFEFKSDGTYTYSSSGTTIKGTWGRLKYNNQLVSRQDSDSYSMGTSIRKSGNRVYCDGFALTRID